MALLMLCVFYNMYAFHLELLGLLVACTGAGAGSLAGHEHDKHHSGTGSGAGFGSDQGYGSGKTGNR